MCRSFRYWLTSSWFRSDRGFSKAVGGRERRGWGGTTLKILRCGPKKGPSSSSPCTSPEPPAHLQYWVEVVWDKSSPVCRFCSGPSLSQGRAYVRMCSVWLKPSLSVEGGSICGNLHQDDVSYVLRSTIFSLKFNS